MRLFGHLYRWSNHLIIWIIVVANVIVSIPHIPRSIVTPGSTDGYYYQQYYSNDNCTGLPTYVKGVRSSGGFYTPGVKPSICIPSDRKQTMGILGSAAYYCNTVNSIYGMAQKLVVYTFNSTDCSGNPKTSATYAMDMCAASSDSMFGASFLLNCNYIPALPIAISNQALVQAQYSTNQTSCGGTSGFDVLPFAFQAFVRASCDQYPITAKVNSHLYYTCGGGTTNKPLRTYWTAANYAQGCLLNHTTPTIPPINAKYGDQLCNLQPKGTTVTFNANMFVPSDNAVMPAQDDMTGTTNTALPITTHLLSTHQLSTNPLITHPLPIHPHPLPHTLFQPPIAPGGVSVQTGYDCYDQCAAIYPECIALIPTSQPTSQPVMRPSAQPTRSLWKLISYTSYNTPSHNTRTQHTVA